MLAASAGLPPFVFQHLGLIRGHAVSNAPESGAAPSFPLGLEHGDFTDEPFWTTPLGRAILRAYIVAFFDRHLKEKEAPLLDGPASAYTAVTVRSRNR